MKKIFLAALLSTAIFSNAAFASSIQSSYTAFKADRLQTVFPHTVSKDGGLLIEEKLTATDYASILFSLGNIQDNSQKLKSNIADTFTGYTVASEFLFIKPDASVISAYEYKEGEYIPSTKMDIASAAQYSMAFNNVLENIDKFNANPSYQKKAGETANKYAYGTADKIFNTMYKEGYFFDDSKKEKFDYKTMANGLISFKILWNLEKNPARKEELKLAVKEIYKVLNASWKANYNVFDFSGDGAKIKFDLRDFGLFLWGISEFSEILAATDQGYEAVGLMINTDKMISVTLIDGITSKEEGIVREIEIVNGQASAVKDEVNTGRLSTFLYGFMKWNSNPFTKVIGMQDKNVKYAKKLILYSVRNHVDEYATIHDTLFSDPSVKNDAKETPYLTWSMIAQDYLLENHSTYLSLAEAKQINQSIEKNYNFLRNNIYQSGKSINEKLGFK